ncbi:hypothetical protein KXW54_003263 [Aspergillus fumigatus]|nr:hypothetical protein KXX10_000320 [Aspergillus fumigatus]KAH1477033.1 hypothetical protein KXX26_002258 [Aspergillus fumigatus]KAH2437205.1 hypothetical protein KXV21_003016 [Aspergillus fumigatus]KAH2471245.1 hypothetical protein KXV61_002970 [Aspergillus fumigatus]KAH2484622.1 hypothetical protein KXV28_002610 [Aspergillus fumigatus]
MLPPRVSAGRIPAVSRPLLPPSSHGLRHQFRPFTHRSRLLLLSPPLGRPQVPFLSPLASTRPLPPLSIHLRQHFARLISTERRDYYKRRLSRGLRIGLTFYAILVLFQVIKLGVYQEEIEHQWPTPSEWSWKSRWCLRSAQALQNPEQIGKLMTNWPMVAGYLRELLERLENLEGEGKGIKEQEEGGIYVEGVGRTGFDITAKSEPWRRGYHQALMGAAKAAENLEGWLTDRKQRISAPAEYVVGPSNPRPKPMPAGQKKVPREEDSEPASPSPEVFYMKILTTKGFDTRQKLDAALAYADWLDYKGLPETARDMYAWAMDIAAAGSSVDASKVVDTKTGVLKNDTQALPSENILRVSTALAVHHARQGNLPTALSIFTSVLKARRSLPPPPPDAKPFVLPSIPKSTRDPFVSLYNSIKTMETGLAWTRDAVDLAESTILELGGFEDHNPQHRCAECLRVGLENWKTMVSQLVAQAEREERESIEKAKHSWFGGEKQMEAKALERKRWEAERLILDDRIKKLWPIIDGGSGLEGIAPNSSLFI